MISGNYQTKQILEDKGIEVWEYRGEEISLKSGSIGERKFPRRELAVPPA